MLNQSSKLTFLSRFFLLFLAFPAKTKTDSLNKASKSVDRKTEKNEIVVPDSKSSTSKNILATSSQPQPQEQDQQQQYSDTMLSPLLRNEADSPDYYKLSSFHVSLMSSVDLFEDYTHRNQVEKKEEPNKEERVVSFRCMHCKEKLLPPEGASGGSRPSFWTTELVANSLCSVLYDHLRTSCEEVPVKTMQRIQAFEAHKKSGKITFSAFIKKFCTENGIYDVRSKGKLSFMTLLKPPTQWDGAQSCRRRAEVLAFVKSNTFPMSGLKVASFQKLERSLSIFNQTALKQVCFMIPLKDRVCIQCKHCGNYTYLNSLAHWYKVMYTMTYSHLIKSCQSIPKAARLKLITQQGKKKQAGNSKTVGLKQYCDILARYYKFEDIHSPNGVKVRGGTIPTDESSNGHNEKKRKMIESKEKDESHGNKKPKLVHSSDAASGGKIAKKGILIEGENGCSAFVTPPNGVPLLCSLTATMASELNVHNKLLINNLELCEEGEPLSSGLSPLSLRCQHCNSHASKSFTKSLTSVEDFFKTLGKCRNHLETCKCTPESIREEIAQTKTTNSIGCITLKEYCKFLADVYGLTDASIGGNGGRPIVTWSNTCKYMLSEYTSTPGILVECKKEAEENGEMISKKNNSSVTDRPRIVLSDYHYFILGQIELINIPPLSTNNSLPDKVKVGVRCKHCGSTKAMASIGNFVCNRLHQFHAHLKCCPEVSNDFIESIEDLKSKDEKQRASHDSASTLEEAAMVVLEDIFQLENSKDQGVVLSTSNAGAWDLIKKLGTSRDNSDLNKCEASVLSVSEIFFPMLLKEVMVPISSFN